MLPKNPYKYPLSELISDGGTVPAVFPFFVILTVFDVEQWIKIVSSGIEGAETIYPYEYNEVVDCLLRGEFMDCNAIANCLLENGAFVNTLKQALLTDGAFVNALGEQLTQQNLIEGNTQDSENQLVKNLKQETNDRDVVWGGSKEVVEYLMDLVKTISFFLSGVSNVQELTEQLYSRYKRKKINLQAEDALNNNQIDVSIDGELVDTGGEWQFVPNILGQLVETITQSTMLGFLSELVNIGAQFVLADMTDTRAEALTCILFNTITCDGGASKEPPYVFDNSVFYDATQNMVLNTDAGLVGQAIAAMIITTGVLNGFVSVFPLDEVHRNYRIGMRAPSSEWIEICDSCDEPIAWEYVFNFLPSNRAEWWTNSTQTTAPNIIVEQTAYTSGKGWGNGRIFDGWRQREDSRIQSSFTATITGIEVEYEGVAGTGGSFFANNLIVRRLDQNGNAIVTPTLVNIAPSMVAAGIYRQSRDFDPIEVRGLQVAVSGYQRAGNNNPNGQTWIRSVTIRGVGINPFV